jgi:hypothetical protein
MTETELRDAAGAERGAASESRPKLPDREALLREERDAARCTGATGRARDAIVLLIINSGTGVSGLWR